MCDTFIALPSATQNNSLIFGKNSDREPNEAQAIVRFPRLKHIEKTVRCTYIDVPQVEETFEVILSKPFWMWGAEMGVNEYGVTIGNEAIFTKVKFQKSISGLTGMDLLRLALERSKTANEALICLTDLLKTYGQDACGGYQNRDFFYHNSFIIADKEEGDYFSLQHDDKAIDYLADYDINKLMPMVKEKLMDLNSNPKGNNLIPYDEMVINKVRFLNHRWIIADFTGNSSWGEVIIKYFIEKDGSVTFETAETIMYPQD